LPGGFWEIFLPVQSKDLRIGVVYEMDAGDAAAAYDHLWLYSEEVHP
jgi:hypothetical protein